MPENARKQELLPNRPASTNPVDADISSIEDEGVRRRIAAAFEQLRDIAEYGLVFEKHRPESVVLYTQPIAEDGYATTREGNGHPGTVFRVISIDDDVATLRPVDDKFRLIGDSECTKPVITLVPVMKFGTPIFPGLVATDKDLLEGDDKPFQTVINGENFHVLELLLYAHERQVDAIYIDPPFNSGAPDWKYNNNYVDRLDRYRHSKWLSMMEKRLSLAKRLLNPENSVLIVAIDEREGPRLGLLLEQVFTGARIQMVSTITNPKGVSVEDGFRRANEFLYFVMYGAAHPARMRLSAEWSPSARSSPFSEESADEPAQVDAEDDSAVAASMSPEWTSMMRRGSDAARSDRPWMFYPIYADPSGPKIVEVGEPIPEGEHEAPAREGLVAILPLRRNKDEGRWQVAPDELRLRIKQGRVRLGRQTSYGYVVNYLPDGAYEQVLSDRFVIEGRADDGSLIAHGVAGDSERIPPTQWKIASHNSSEYGKSLLRQFAPGREFPFPKSLYAVEDALRFFVLDKPDALIVDFFAGSGTTTHAVMRLNRQDNGRRRSVIITNNEVSPAEQKSLRRRGLFPGDPEWEKLGICQYITKPRIEAAITGKTWDGRPVEGNYKFTDPFAMNEGFAENARFFDLLYLDPDRVEAKQAFAHIAYLLWLMAGAQGRAITNEPKCGWSLPDDATYGILFRNKGRAAMAEALSKRVAIGNPVQRVFIVADSGDEFVRSRDELGVLPEQSTRLYRDYLKNFRTNVTDTQGSQ